MNTVQIDKIMNTDEYTKNTYLGTLSIDRLPKKVLFPSCIIINNQTSKEPGEHWIAIYFDKKGGEFFDSFGNPPKYYNLEAYLRKKCKHFKFNRKVAIRFFILLWILLRFVFATKIQRNSYGKNSKIFFNTKQK